MLTNPKEKDSKLQQRIESTGSLAFTRRDSAQSPAVRNAVSISNGQYPSNREAGEPLRQTQHKSLLITNSPVRLIRGNSNNPGPESDSLQPANLHKKSHDMQIECKPLLQEVALGLSQLASLVRTGKSPEAEVDVHASKVWSLCLPASYLFLLMQFKLLKSSGREVVLLINRPADAGVG